MARARKSARLSVALNGRPVGVLDRAANGAISFVYDKEWLADERRAIPVSLSLPLREERYSGAEVSAFFDNLLPDNDQIRRKVAEKVGAEGTDAFSLLNKIGRDCVGALQFVPEGGEITPPGPPECAPLSDADVADIIRNLATSPLGIRPDGERELRISIAGAQEKTALLWDNGWCLPKGTTPTTHILKPELGKLPNGLDMTLSVENEHFCLTLCRELGLDVAQSQIVTFDDVRVLAVERFDRLKASDGRLLRVPQEDFCQALSVPPTIKYNSDGGPGIRECLNLLNGSDYAEEDRLAFLKAQVAFWLIGAPDGHAKNFSLFLTPGGRYRMTPLYDIMSTQPNYAAKQLQRREFRLAMAVGDKRHYHIDEIMPRHFLQNAKAEGVAEEKVEALFAELAKETGNAIDRAISQMPKGFAPDIVEPIAEGAHSRVSRIEQHLELAKEATS
ncbi:type II toxin-antitoxin system HipA family toxin [Thalassospira indica]|uniref:Type II toxin-antitoxin system HipA family toxin n=1 Tax=Thalassospira indica TaxID=1891279 RepID=A0ABM6Y3R7_9PROT|nr:type II toxin-antitoxin system HipA family toxin [Thalassospira indica]AXO16503.1 type II toxin-antitoxin system HipA family toxin [Thalassospira indica]OAZ10656.1 toxin HipA [Thalassospira profundimaris]